MAYKLKEKKMLHLEIEDAKFDLRVDAILLERVRKSGEEMVKYSEDPATQNDSVDDQMAFMCDRIDDILGDGAADQIFEGTDADMLDAIDVYTYITRQIDDASKNREQRRAANKQPQKAVVGKHKRYKGNHK